MRILIVVGLILGGGHAFAQRTQVSNRLTIYAVAATNQVLNGAPFTSGSYQSPSFFGNFSVSSSVGVSGSYRLRGSIGPGLDVLWTSFKSWSNAESTRFDGARHSMVAVTPKLQVQTKFQPGGLWNRLTLVASVGPSFGFHSSELTKPPFVSVPPNESFQQSSYVSAGFVASGEIRWNLAVRFSLGVACTYAQYKIKSHLYDDQSLQMFSLTGMAGYRLKIDRRFKYADP